MSTSFQPPKYVSDLMELYGHSSGKLLGSEVFYDILKPEVDLEPVALRHHREFVGAKFFEPKEEGWLRGWKLLYRRPEGQPGNIVQEFEAVYDILEKVLEKFLNPFRGNDDQTAPQKLAIAFWTGRSPFRLLVSCPALGKLPVSEIASSNSVVVEARSGKIKGHCWRFMLVIYLEYCYQFYPKRLGEGGNFPPSYPMKAKTLIRHQ